MSYNYRECSFCWHVGLRGCLSDSLSIQQSCESLPPGPVLTKPAWLPELRNRTDHITYLASLTLRSPLRYFRPVQLFDFKKCIPTQPPWSVIIYNPWLDWLSDKAPQDASAQDILKSIQVLPSQRHLSHLVAVADEALTILPPAFSWVHH